MLHLKHGNAQVSITVPSSSFYCRKSGDTLSKEFDKNRDEFARSFSEDKSLDEIEPYEELGEEENPVNLVPVAPLSPIGESDEDEKEIPSDVPSKVHTCTCACCKSRYIHTLYMYMCML